MEQKISTGRHIGIPVSDIDKMKNFYIDYLGFKIVSDEIEEGEFISEILGLSDIKVHIVKMITSDGWMLELLQYVNLNEDRIHFKRKIFDIGIAHIALTVYNIDEFYTFLKKKNISFISPPKISPSKKAKVSFCQDPEGNYIELVEVL